MVEKTSTTSDAKHLKGSVLGKRLKLPDEVELPPLDDTVYEVKEGLRFVKPYEH
jgi:hypothetical protein